MPQFFDEIESAIGQIRAQHNVRIFNLSLNVVQPVALDKYSYCANRLDKIVEDNDVVVFVSAGNLAPQNQRLEWPNDPAQALGHIAASIDDRLLVPAESVRNVSVAAVNPPNHSASIAFARAGIVDAVPVCVQG